MGLHPRAINLILLLVLELMFRGYRVCLSTHSPQVLEMAWALRQVVQNEADGTLLNKLFEIKGNPLRDVFASALTKKVMVHYFDRDGNVKDISNLDLDADESSEGLWGGLLEFSNRANDIVATSASDAFFRSVR
jgi:predicted ATP-binding protein involved in virulence